jgi:hypothetical protein
VQFRPQSVVDLSAALSISWSLASSMIAVRDTVLAMESKLSTSTITVISEAPPRVLCRFTATEFAMEFGAMSTPLPMGIWSFAPAIAADGALLLTLRQIPGKANITAFDLQTRVCVRCPCAD